jgi:predicted SAM-dependent methyltransferase
MRAFVEHVRPPAGARIVDLGGSEHLWNLLDHDYRVTLVNLPGWNTEAPGDPRVSLVEADACRLEGVFKDRSFDVVFSNSTIEHVGDEGAQEAFARQVKRLAGSYWVQTPSRRFPVEAHTGVPLYWQLPERVRKRLVARWRKRLPQWAEMVDGTRVLSAARMRSLFEGANLYVERVMGMEKSFAAYRSFDGHGSTS